MNVLVIGGGLFGIVTALVLSEDDKNKVSLYEATDKLLNGASKNNHNRLHFGFHYPRSVETALQSKEGIASFFVNFKDAINVNFDNYYMIDNNSSHVSAQQYIEFCDTINVSYKEKWPDVDIDRNKISISILTQEPVFDYDIIYKILMEKLTASNVNVFTNKKVTSFEQCNEFDVIINATYNNINSINNILGADNIELKLQDVIIPVIEYENSPVGLTVMDGNFCSIMPNGFKENVFLLYHVTESVIDECVGFSYNRIVDDVNIKTFFSKTEEYFKFINKCKHIGTYRSMRALPINKNDERLTSCFTLNTEKQILITILSGKVSTCWDTAYKIKTILK